VSEPPAGERAVHRGVHWWRDSQGRVSFYDADGGRWVRWVEGGDAPPLPPRWSLLGVPTRVTRPGWRSPWRLVPLALVVAAVVIAVLQAVLPSPSNTAKEAAAAEALAGKCLPRRGSGFSGHPVPCTSPSAAVRVVSVLPSTPGSPLCPAGTRGVELAYPGVRYPHIECVVPVHPAPTAPAGG
jgi:hypothetical protein